MGYAPILRLARPLAVIRKKEEKSKKSYLCKYER
jgi:hypothetical protein